MDGTWKGFKRRWPVGRSVRPPAWSDQQSTVGRLIRKVVRRISDDETYSYALTRCGTATVAAVPGLWLAAALPWAPQ